MSEMKKNKPSFGEGAAIFVVGLLICFVPGGVIAGIPLVIIGCVIMAG